MTRRSNLRVGVALVATLAGAVLTVVGLVQFPGSSSVPTSVAPFSAPDATPQGPTETPEMQVTDMAPDSVFVPEIGAYAPVVPVGVVAGALQIPSDPAVVGRDEQTAPLPADGGATFLAGHVQAGGVDGALHDLTQVRAGSRVFTRDDEGAVREWVVTSLRTSRGKTMDPADFSTDGERRLVLVTCTGPVVATGDRRSFRDAVVVTAVPVPEPSVDARSVNAA